MQRRRLARGPATGLGLAAAALALGLTTTACDSIAENVAERAVEEAAEAANGGGEVDVEVDEEGGNISVTSSEGSFSVGGAQEVPSDFPEAVPLPDDAEVVSSMSFTDGGDASHNLSMTVPDEPTPLAEHLRETFAGDGFTITSTSDMTMDGQQTHSFGFEGDEAEGSVTVAGNPDGTIVSYTVQSGTATGS